jgi:hypothetical protein
LSVSVYEPDRIKATARNHRKLTGLHCAKPDIVLMVITSQLRPSLALGEVWLSDWQAG